MALEALLLEPWYGGSHRAWADGLVRHSRHHVTLLTLPGRHWRWRLRGAALTLADAVDAHVAIHGRPDVVVVSGMVDLAALRGFARDALGSVPVALYLHENQVVYPEGPARQAGDPAGWTTWSSMAAADLVLLASAHHRDALLAALGPFLARAPDHGHERHLTRVRGRCEVLPVGVELDALLAGARRGCEVTGLPPLVVWNQRWDEDRRPERLLRILGHLADEGVPFRVALAGPRTRPLPPELGTAVDRLGDRVVHLGWCEPDAYRALLLRSDVVASVTRHEYFGVGVVEAVAAGAVPLLPARLSYPEVLPVEAHTRCLYAARPAERLRSLLVGIEEIRSDPAVAGVRAAMSRWGWPEVAPRYDDRLELLAVTGR